VHACICSPDTQQPFSRVSKTGFQVAILVHGHTSWSFSILAAELTCAA